MPSLRPRSTLPPLRLKTFLLGVGGLVVAVAVIGLIVAFKPNQRGGRGYVPPDRSPRDNGRGESMVDYLYRTRRPAAQGPDGNMVPAGSETP
jgi:hypothetical protein